jgi:hypothetical protein
MCFLIHFATPISSARNVSISQMPQFLTESIPDRVGPCGRSTFTYCSKWNPTNGQGLCVRKERRDGKVKVVYSRVHSGLTYYVYRIKGWWETKDHTVVQTPLTQSPKSTTLYTYNMCHCFSVLSVCSTDIKGQTLEGSYKKRPGS